MLIRSFYIFREKYSRQPEEMKFNKRFKRDSQRVAFLLCVGFCGYGVMRKVSSSVGCPLSGRYTNWHSTTKYTKDLSMGKMKDTLMNYVSQLMEKMVATGRGMKIHLEQSYSLIFKGG
ncbi:hypothetical protein ACT691_03520 [Vibrio metschnikovii]